MTHNIENLLLLFDIDGTLITGKGIPKQVFYEVVLNRFPYLDPEPDIPISGQTDPLIIEKLLYSGGYKYPIEPSLIKDMLQEFTGLLAKRLLGENAPHVLPGVLQLMENLTAQKNCYLGLVTGNVSRGAAIKLRASGLYKYFPVGAFGDDSKIRSDLPPMAIRRCEAYYQQSFPPQNIWIIGDSIYDVRCAHANDLPCLAVATSKTPYSELESESPEILVNSFMETGNLPQMLRSFQR